MNIMKQSKAPAVLAALLAMAFHFGSIDASFVYDDIPYIVKNPQLEAPADMFLTPFPAHMGPSRGLYRPMTTASLALDRAVFGPEPWGYHLTNILLHGFCVLVLCLVLYRLVSGRWGAFFGALLFGLHPAGTEAVAWATGRSELLAGLCCLAALLFYLQSVEHKKPSFHLFLSLAAFTVGALSKENALAFPGILVAYEVLVNRSSPWKRKLLRTAPFVVVLLMVAAARFVVLGSFSPGEGQHVLPNIVFPERFALGAWILSRYVAITILPIALKPHYRPLEFMDAGFVDYLPALLFAAVLVVTVFLCKKQAFAAAVFFVPLITVLNIVPIGELVAERFLYLPLAGVSLAAALLAVRVKKRGAALAGSTAAVVLLSMLAFQTVRQVEVWTDHFTLWSHAVENDPVNPQARFGLGKACLERGMLEGTPGALSEFKKARELNPNYKPHEVLVNLGWTYELLGRTKAALASHMEAIRANPCCAPALEAVLKVALRAGESGDSSLGQALPPPKRLRAFAEQLLSITPDAAEKERLRREFREFLL